MRKTIIFDLDDTLIYNQYLHYRSEILWLQYAVHFFFSERKDMMETIDTIVRQAYIDGFHTRSPQEYLSVYDDAIVQPLRDILATMSGIDVESVESAKLRGMNAFSSTRFPTTLVKTFIIFCKKYQREYQESHCQEVFRIGQKTFTVEAAPIEGALDVLRFIKEKKQEMLLFTKGDEKVQYRKLELNGMTSFFDEVHVVTHKDEAVFKAIIGDRKKERVIMVGNSFRSDILPALHVGIRAIFVPRETWSYEDDINAMRLDQKLMIPIERIEQIKEIFYRL